jgi:TRAP-type transport system periplasmic protein
MMNHFSRTVRLVAASALAACVLSGSVSAAEQWSYYIHQSAPQFATSRGAKLLTEEVEKATGGELKLRLHLAGTLQINASNITTAVGDNIVQMGDDLFNSGNVPFAGLLRLPMLIQSYEEYEKASEVLRPYLEKSFASKGAVLLGAYTYPMQVIWGRRQITSLDDIKGVKLRVASPEQGEFVRRFGGVSITMGAPEVPSALDRGVVDGILTGGVGAVLWKDLLKSGYMLVVNINNSYIIANADAFKKLSPDLQAKLRKTVEENARWNQETMKKEEEAATSELKSIGYTITPATPQDAATATDRVKSYWDEWAKAKGPELVEALGKVRTALGR